MLQLKSPDSRTLETTDIKDMEMIVFPANLDQAKDQLDNIFHRFSDDGERVEITDPNEKTNAIIEEIQRFTSTFSPESEWNKEYILMLVELYSAMDTLINFGFFSPNTHYAKLMEEKDIPHIADYQPYNHKMVSALFSKLKINPQRRRNTIYKPNPKLGITFLNICFYGSPGSGGGIFTNGLDAEAKSKVMHFYQATEKYLRGANAPGYYW